jgi:xylose dehydrogenase (NAD/NADP)
MNMNQKLKWGVLGYAKIAREKVIPAILQAKNAEFYAIASRDPLKLSQCRQKYPDIKLYQSYDDLLNDAEVDVVYIPLPNGLHKEWTIKAAQQKKHILCEKPLSLSVADCIEMASICKEYNVKLMEAFMYQYSNRTQKIKKLLADDMIGKIKYIHSSFRFYFDKEPDARWERNMGGGSLFDVGCYPINFLGMVLNELPISLSGEYIPKNEVDLSFAAVLKYQSGVMASISCGFDSFNYIETEIIGTNGKIKVPDTFFGNPGKIYLRTNEEELEINVSASDNYLLEVEDFTEAVCSNRNPLVNLDDSIKNMKVLESLAQIFRIQAF